MTQKKFAAAIFITGLGAADGAAFLPGGRVRGASDVPSDVSTAASTSWDSDMDQIVRKFTTDQRLLFELEQRKIQKRTQKKAMERYLTREKFAKVVELMPNNGVWEQRYQSLDWLVGDLKVEGNEEKEEMEDEIVSMHLLISAQEAKVKADKRDAELEAQNMLPKDFSSSVDGGKYFDGVTINNWGKRIEEEILEQQVAVKTEKVDKKIISKLKTLLKSPEHTVEAYKKAHHAYWSLMRENDDDRKGEWRRGEWRRLINDKYLVKDAVLTYAIETLEIDLRMPSQVKVYLLNGLKQFYKTVYGLSADDEVPPALCPGKDPGYDIDQDDVYVGREDAELSDEMKIESDSVSLEEKGKLLLKPFLFFTMFQDRQTISYENYDAANRNFKTLMKWFKEGKNVYKSPVNQAAFCSPLNEKLLYLDRKNSTKGNNIQIGKDIAKCNGADAYMILNNTLVEAAQKISQKEKVPSVGEYTKITQFFMNEESKKSQTLRGRLMQLSLPEIEMAMKSLNEGMLFTVDSHDTSDEAAIKAKRNVAFLLGTEAWLASGLANSFSFSFTTSQLEKAKVKHYLNEKERKAAQKALCVAVGVTSVMVTIGSGGLLLAPASGTALAIANSLALTAAISGYKHASDESKRSDTASFAKAVCWETAKKAPILIVAGVAATGAEHVVKHSLEHGMLNGLHNFFLRHAIANGDQWAYKTAEVLTHVTVAEGTDGAREYREVSLEVSDPHHRHHEQSEVIHEVAKGAVGNWVVGMLATAAYVHAHAALHHVVAAAS